MSVSFRRVLAALAASAVIAVAALVVPLVRERHAQALEDSMRPTGPGVVRYWSLRDMLQRADTIHISRIVYEGDQGATYNSKFIEKKERPDVFARLKAAKRFHRTAPTQRRDFQFVLYAAGDSVYEVRTFDYVSATGELGRGSEWCYLSKAFRAWMERVKMSLPARKPFDAADKKPAIGGASVLGAKRR